MTDVRKHMSKGAAAVAVAAVLVGIGAGAPAFAAPRDGWAPPTGWTATEVYYELAPEGHDQRTLRLSSRTPYGPADFPSLGLLGPATLVVGYEQSTAMIHSPDAVIRTDGSYEWRFDPASIDTDGDIASVSGAGGGAVVLRFAPDGDTFTGAADVTIGFADGQTVDTRDIVLETVIFGDHDAFIDRYLKVEPR